MKRLLVVIVAIVTMANTAMAATSLVVKPLSGKECITALGCIGKLVYSGDSLYVYDKEQTLVFSDLLANVQHIRFSNEQPSTPTSVENTQGESTLLLKVYPNPTHDLLIVENAPAKLLRLYTMHGMLVGTHTVTKGKAQVNMSDLPTGNYLLISGNQSFQVIKQ